MSVKGRVEVLSSLCAIGWAETTRSYPTHVYATSGNDVIGTAYADLIRPDLVRLSSSGVIEARAFSMVFNRKIAKDEVSKINVWITGHEKNLLYPSANLRIDRNPPLRVFILGSPRSGTSELGDTLARQLGLPWLGEGHAAPHFAEAAAALSGDPEAPNALVRFMAIQNINRVADRYLQKTYYFMHASASFIDKTPGIPMIRVAPFLANCFPDAKFIYLRRNGISNVLSRLSKFGGNFVSHCRDWVGAMNEWLIVRRQLPHYLELEQEEMLSDPHSIALKIVAYLEEPGALELITESLRTGSREHTGAGIGREALEDTGWTPDECDIFTKICGATMVAYGYWVE